MAPPIPIGLRPIVLVRRRSRVPYPKFLHQIPDPPIQFIIRLYPHIPNHLDYRDEKRYLLDHFLYLLFPSVLSPLPQFLNSYARPW